MTYHGASRGDDVSLFNGHLGIINRIKHLRLLRVSLSNQVPLSPVPDPPAANNLAQSVGVSPECERMQFALILNFAGALEEGRGMRRGQTTGAQKEDTRHFGLRLLSVLQEDAGVVSRRWNGIEMSVMHLEDQELDIRIFSHSILL